MITDIEQLDLNKRYTYADYLTWQFREMVELIRGKVVQMSPAPGTATKEYPVISTGSFLPFCSANNARYLPLPLMSAYRFLLKNKVRHCARLSPE